MGEEGPQAGVGERVGEVPDEGVGLYWRSCGVGFERCRVGGEEKLGVDEEEHAEADCNA